MIDPHTERLMMGAAGAGGDKIYMENLYDTQVWQGINDGQIVPRRIATSRKGQALGRSGSGKSLLLNSGYSQYKGALPPASNTDTTACFTRLGALSGATPGKTFTISFWWWPPQTQTAPRVITFGQNDVNRERFDLTIGHYFAVNARDSGGSRFLDVNTSSYQPVARGEWNHIIISFDLSDTGKRKAYINDTLVTNWTWGTYSNQNIAWDVDSLGIFCNRGAGGSISGTKLKGYVSNFYMDLTYTELGTESNRRIFRTADGEPTSTSTLTARNPLIYLPLNDADTLTTNLGTGGNYTKNDSGSQNYPVVDFGPYLGDAIDAKGGMVWQKKRDATANHTLFDTVRGVNLCLNSNTNSPSYTISSSITSFNTDGYSIGTDGDINSNATWVDWSFTKQEQFFDIQSWTGNGVDGRTIAHNLGSVPGFILVKRTDTNQDWAVYHRSLTARKVFYLNSDGGTVTDSDPWNDTEPTSSVFTVGDHAMVNASSGTYIAYLFANGGASAAYAGGASGISAYVKGDGPLSVSGVSYTTGPFGVANTAVNFTGGNNPLSQPAIWNTGSSNYTIECWFKAGSTAWSQSWSMLMSRWVSNSSIYLGLRSGGKIHFYNSLSSESGNVDAGWTQDTWHHVAIVREGTGSNQTHMYLDGVKKHSWTDNTNITNSTSPIGFGYNNQPVNTENLTGQISNARVTIGQALYTANFTPATSDLTTTSQGAKVDNVKFLGLNGNAATVNDLTTSDPLVSIFGEKGNQDAIKCGYYLGNGSATGPEVFLGWEPQWVIIKRASGAEDWMIFDSLRSSERDHMQVDDLRANVTNAESDGAGSDGNPYIRWTSTGFKLTSNTTHTNSNGSTYIFVAIRRPDGAIGKPADLGTDWFAMAPGNGSGDIPNFTSYFPVDFGFYRAVSSDHGWEETSRLQGIRYVYMERTNAESYWNKLVFDSNLGMQNHSTHGSNYQAWMWKRGAGFDEVLYTGWAGGSLGPQVVNHSLGRTPEMIWVKMRDGTSNWWVYHKGLNGGTNPQNYHMILNTEAAEVASDAWNDTAPTSKTFTLDDSMGTTNDGGQTYLACLFASVDGVSKVGHYTGDGSASMNIECGFQPRFVIMTRSDTAQKWVVFDTRRGWAAGTNSYYLRLNADNAQTQTDWGSGPYSTGFNVNTWVSAGQKVIYYAHA